MVKKRQESSETETDAEFGGSRLKSDGRSPGQKAEATYVHEHAAVYGDTGRRAVGNRSPRTRHILPQKAAVSVSRTGIDR